MLEPRKRRNDFIENRDFGRFVDGETSRVPRSQRDTAIRVWRQNIPRMLQVLDCAVEVVRKYREISAGKSMPWLRQSSFPSSANIGSRLPSMERIRNVADRGRPRFLDRGFDNVKREDEATLDIGFAPIDLV